MQRISPQTNAVSNTVKMAMFLAVIATPGCGGGTFWGNILVLGVSLAIFGGTLAIGRRHSSTRSGMGSRPERKE